MKNYNLIPGYLHPTMVLMVDDSQNFLEGISFQLHDELIFQLYDKPYQALQFLKEEYQFQKNANLKINSIDLNIVCEQLYNANRYKEVSVVMVDYCMPSMNGLDFCRQIENLPIKKILITGEADQEIAIKAFNDNIIDKFIHKNDYDFTKKINDFIMELQWDYFCNISNKISTEEKSKNLSCLQDPLFSDFFKHICKEHKIIEFYFFEKFNSFLLLDIDAKLYILSLKTPMETNSFAEIKGHIQKNILQKLKTDNFLIFQGLDIPFQREAIDPRNLYPTNRIRGDKIYNYALIKDYKENLIETDKIVSYRQFSGL